MTEITSHSNHNTASCPTIHQNYTECLSTFSKYLHKNSCAEPLHIIYGIDYCIKLLQTSLAQEQNSDLARIEIKENIENHKNLSGRLYRVYFSYLGSGWNYLSLDERSTESKLEHEGEVELMQNVNLERCNESDGKSKHGVEVELIENKNLETSDENNEDSCCFYLKYLMC